MKSYSQFRHELTRKKVLENLVQAQPVLPAQPVPQQPTQVQPQQPVQQQQNPPQPGQPQQQAVDPKNPSQFFKGMNFAPGRRWEMMKRVQQNGQVPPQIPGQPPMPQTPV